jgi:two-component system osmolarity sensor histidine kinase EnvZ
MLKRLMPKSLFARAIIIVVAPVVLLQIVAAIVFFDRHLDTVARRLALSVANDVAYVGEQLQTTADTTQIPSLLIHASRRLNLGFSWYAGQHVTETDLPDTLSPIETIFFRALGESLDAPYNVEDRSPEKAYVLRLAVGDGTLEVVVPHYRVTAGSANILLLWSVGSSLLLLTIAILFLRNQVRPIGALANAAERFGKGQDVADFKPSGATEVRQAAAAFLEMKERIERQIRQRTEMLAGVSHDLRTPLTRMKLALAMQDESDDVRDMRDDVADMETMIEGYLAFARGADGEAAVTVDLTELLAEIVADARRAGAEIELETGGSLHARLQVGGLKRCLTNLVDNARAYADHARMSARRDGDMIRITVDDDGPGIAEDKREEVFRPFYRIEESRNRGTGGVGLGLAIARDVVRGQGGDIDLDESPLGGLRVVVSLPA